MHTQRDQSELPLSGAVESSTSPTLPPRPPKVTPLNVDHVSSFLNLLKLSLSCNTYLQHESDLVVDLHGVPYRVVVRPLEASNEASAAGLQVFRIYVTPPWDRQIRNLPPEDVPFYTDSMRIVACISPEAVTALELESRSSAARKYLLNKKVEGPAQWEDRLEYTALATELPGVAPGIAAFLKARAFAFCGGPLPERSVFQELIKVGIILTPPKLCDPRTTSGAIAAPKFLAAPEDSFDTSISLATEDDGKYRIAALRLSTRELEYYVHTEASSAARKSLEEIEREMENPPPGSIWAQLKEDLKQKPIVEV